MATLKEINDLKASWIEDPCWDLDATEGFEEHSTELKAFAEAQYQQWAAERKSRLETRAEEIGCPGNVVLAEYVELLEDRLADLERRIRRTEELMMNGSNQPRALR